jgi:hypothetical protein
LIVHGGAPIALGVVGHRDLRPSDRQALREAIASVISELRAAYPHTPVLLLSPLAEGADQLAVEVALEKRCLVRAPLPFSPAVYRETSSFRSEETRLNFDHLLSHPAVDSFVVPWPDGTGPDPTDAQAFTGDGAAAMANRRRGYANAGGYVARHCDVLLALWDGGAPHGPSGTAEFVRLKLFGTPPELYPWNDPLGFATDCGPVYVIHTPRPDAEPTDRLGSPTLWLPPRSHTMGGSAPPDILSEHSLAMRVSDFARFRGRLWDSIGLGQIAAWARSRPLWAWLARSSTAPRGPLPAELRQVRDRWLAIEDLNTDLASMHSFRASRPKSMHRARAGARIQTAAGSDALLELERLRAASGRLAQDLDLGVLWRQIGFFVTLFLAVFTFHIYAHLPVKGNEAARYPVYIWSCMIAIILSAVILMRLWWQRMDQRRLDYRALAEALRVCLAWGKAGVTRAVPDSYLGHLRGEVAWIRRVLYHVSPPPEMWRAAFMSLPLKRQIEELREVYNSWVLGQVHYYSRQHRRRHMQSIGFRAVGFTLAVLGWVLTGSLSVGMFKAAGGVKWGQSPHPWALILIGALLLAGGLIMAFGESRSYDEIAKQFDRMQSVFENGAHRLHDHLRDAHEDLDHARHREAREAVADAQAVIEALGQEALIENGYWLVLCRARSFELHVG